MKRKTRKTKKIRKIRKKKRKKRKKKRKMKMICSTLCHKWQANMLFPAEEAYLKTIKILGYRGKKKK